MTELGHEGEARSTRDILRRIMAQRAQRYTDAGPDLTSLGVARFRHDGARLLVAYAEIAPQRAGEAVARTMAHSHLRGMRVIWTVSIETPEDRELARALLAHGFALDERLILMARQGELRTQINPAVTIAPIVTWSAMWAYEHGSRRSFYGDATPDDGLVTARARERWRQQQMGWYRYYVATLNGQIVGGLYVSLWEDVPTLMGVYTLESTRHRGVATSAMAYAVHDLVSSGHDVYCLFVKDDNPAQALYRSLGFRALITEETYISSG